MAWCARQVDGPHHFSSNTLQPTGATALKRRLLRRLHWKLISVPFFEWERLCSPLAQQVSPSARPACTTCEANPEGRQM